MYRLGDRDSDGVLDRERFQDGTPGLDSVQKDVLKAMANPNTDLNDFNPDRNRFKEVDKTDVAGILQESSSYVHTCEFSLEEPGRTTVRSLGRVTGKRGALLSALRIIWGISARSATTPRFPSASPSSCASRKTGCA